MHEGVIKTNFFSILEDVVYCSACPLVHHHKAKNAKIIKTMIIAPSRMTEEGEFPRFSFSFLIIIAVWVHGNLLPFTLI